MRLSVPAFVVSAVLIVAACGAPSPSISALSPSIVSSPPSIASPSPSTASTSAPWVTADIVYPEAVTSAPSLQPGYQCHPCHYLAESDFFGVAPVPGGLIAVGVQQPPAFGIADGSTDGTHWSSLIGFPVQPGSAAIAVASDGRRVVVVGSHPDGATSWAWSGASGGSAAGASSASAASGGPVAGVGRWSIAPRQAALHVDYAAGAMTSVVPFDGGFIAGGYRDDPLHLRASAAIWRSRDGLTWTLDASRSASAAFAGGRIWGVAVSGTTLVAVGTDGDPNVGPAAAWRWSAASGWQRARIGPSSDGAMRAVTSTPTGFVAVGLDGADAGARAWTSADGLTWTAVPDQPAFHYAALAVRMQSIAWTSGGLVAGGWRSDQGKGSAVTWSSPDGIHWTGPTWEAEFSGGQIRGVAPLGDGSGVAVAVGRTGYPDWNRATAWWSSAP